MAGCLLAAAMAFSFGCGLFERRPERPVGTPAAAPEITATPTPFVPAYVPAECQGRTLATVNPAAAGAPTPTADGVPALTRDDQQAILRAVLATVEKVYIDPTRLGAEWQSAVEALTARTDAGLEREAFYDEIQALISVLGDEHSQFESPAEVKAAEAALAGTAEQVGIGVLAMGIPEAGLVTVLKVYGGSPAERAGIEAHDNLLSVDGAPLIQGGIPQPWRLRGPECTMLVVSVATPGEPARQVTLVRHRYAVDQAIEARLLPTLDGSRIGYVFLPSFFDERIPSQVEAALQAFGPLDGLVIDNRVNDGGSSSVLEPVLSLFTSGNVGEYVSRTGTRALTIVPRDVQGSQSLPLIVLIGEDTASYGEVFAGVLQDSRRARLVGEATAGNVETLHGYSFDDGSRLWIAEERFLPTGSRAVWEGVGVQPDVWVSAAWHTFTSDDDPAVAAALGLLAQE